MKPGEDELLEVEKKRLNNVEKLSNLSDESFAILYENADSVTSGLEKVGRMTEELSGFDPKFTEYREPLESAQAILEDLAYVLRGF